MLHIVNYSRVSNNLTLHVYGQIKRSHSIHMLSIQIDTKTVELVMFPCLIDDARLLDTLE